jgi:hypothetical protein
VPGRLIRQPGPTTELPRVGFRGPRQPTAAQLCPTHARSLLMNLALAKVRITIQVKLKTWRSSWEALGRNGESYGHLSHVSPRISTACMGQPCRQSRDHVSQLSPSSQARARRKPTHRSHQRLPSCALLEFFSNSAHANPFACVPTLAFPPSGPDPGPDAPGPKPCRSQSALLGARSPKGHNCGPSPSDPPPVRGRLFVPGDENR